MNFKDYVAQSAKKYNYRIKSLADLREYTAKIEEYLKRYNILSMSKPKKTIIQKRPLDFPEVQNREVYMMDVTLGLPVSGYIVERELVGYLGLPGDYLVVRGENDQLEIQNEVLAQNAEIADEATKKKLIPATLMGVDTVYPEAEQQVDGSNYYGDSYNSRFLGYLKELSDERKEKQKVDAPAPLFSWMNMPESDADAGDFNKDHRPDIKPEDKDVRTPAKTGNFDDEGKVVKKTFKKQGAAGRGERASQTLKGKPESIRKE